jgi:replicative superfamily II helicase
MHYGQSMATPTIYTPEQWAEVKSLYETTKLSITKISAKTGINPQAIESKVRRSDWTRPNITTEAKLVKKAQVQLERRIESRVARKAEDLAERAAEFKMRAIEQSFETLDVVKNLTERLKNEHLDVETLSECVQKLTSSHKQLTDASWKQFGLDNERTTVKVGLFLPVTILNEEPTNATYPATIDVDIVSPAGSTPTDISTPVD